MTFTVCRLAPKLFNTHGDSENARVLAHRASTYGYPAVEIEWDGVGALDNRPDVVVVGSPMEFQRAEALGVLRGAWSMLSQWVDQGSVAFFAGNSIEFLGADAGSDEPGVGVVDLSVTALPGHQSEFVQVTHPLGSVVGFINRDRMVSVAAVHEPGVITAAPHAPAGHDLVIAGRVMATALRGPVLATHPWLADTVLSRAGVVIPESRPGSLMTLDSYAREVTERIRATAL